MSQRPPTGSGIIGQTGNKPGSSYLGQSMPPRQELIDRAARDEFRRGESIDTGPKVATTPDPRLREPQREYSAKFYADQDTAIVRMGIALFAACAVAGFVFGYSFGRTL